MSNNASICLDNSCPEYIESIQEPTLKKELDKCSLVLDDDMAFPKATVSPSLIKLQADVTEFITSVILKHEREFYRLVNTHFADEFETILGNTTASVISMITETTNKFYNKLYFDVQNSNKNGLVATIIEMSELAGYGAHILLDKLLRLTLEIHLDVVREQLAFSDRKSLRDYDLYEKSLLMQINTCILSINLLHVLSKGADEDGPFIPIPEGENAFNIVIDKNIENY